MAFDVHGMNLLRYSAARQEFGRVATIGRQLINIPTRRVRSLLKSATAIGDSCYSEQVLMGNFGAQSVESYDNSDYENATHIVDMNKPIEVTRQYDTIIDGGCLEHIYNVPQALANVSSLCAAGGQILHILPANNFCGHGFWQMSPELFFSLYCARNGYAETEVFIADLADDEHWYAVKPPINGQRANAASVSPLYALVRTRKAGSHFTHDNIQQSDYVHVWNEAAPDSRPQAPRLDFKRRLELRFASSPGLLRMLKRGYWTYLSPFTLTRRNSQLVRQRVADLVAVEAPAVG